MNESQTLTAPDECKRVFLTKIRALSEKYGCVHDGHAVTAALARTMRSFTCERRIAYLLENNHSCGENQRFDSYYRQKSEFATINILDHIKASLSANGVDAIIFTELRSNIGRYDIAIASSNSGDTYSGSVKKIRVEVRANLGLDFEQLSRYLWEPSPLILVRVMTQHVAKILPSELQSYTIFSLTESTAKIDRLLSGKTYSVPGIDCISCQDTDCINWRKRNNWKQENIVTFPDVEFAEDLTSFFKNLSYVAERTATMVVEELQGSVSSRNQVRSIPSIPRLE